MTCLKPAGAAGILWDAMTRQSALERPIKDALAARAMELVQVYRHGPYRIEILFRHTTGYYWTIGTSVDSDREPAWTQDELDATLARQMSKRISTWTEPPR